MIGNCAVLGEGEGLSLFMHVVFLSGCCGGLRLLTFFEHAPRFFAHLNFF